jgi:hypothetical protein
MGAKERESQFEIYDETTTSTAMPDHDRQSTSPSPYDADGSDGDSVLPSIEFSPGNRKSSAAFTAISSIPPSLPDNTSFYTPQKGPRQAFRSPGSVRALQMSSPPPFASPGSSLRQYGRALESPTSSKRYRPGTPSSLTSGSPRREDVQNYAHSSRSGTPMTEHRDFSPKVRGPLVLLHVTLLPCPTLAYSTKSIAELAPSYFLENWRLLQEKVGDTILARGILIPHPGEEYDLLEERVLESLDLCTPRILDCGHFYSPDEDMEDDSGTDSGVSDVGRESALPTETPHKASEQALDDEFCACCSKPVHGVITGRSRRWNLRIYAANGMMKAGAWAASYSEMERIDVEIEPWLPEDVKRELDNRRVQEDQQEQKLAEDADRLRVEVEEMESKKEDEEKAKLEAIEQAKQMEKKMKDEEGAKLEAVEKAKRMEMEKEDLEKAKLEAIKKATLMELEVQKLNTALLLASQTPASESTQSKHIVDTPKESTPATVADPALDAKPAAQPLSKDIPLSKLLFNYIYLLAQDRRNIALAMLSVLVVFLAMRSSSTNPTTIPSSAKPLVSFAETTQLAAHSPSLSVTSIQTSTNLDTGATDIPTMASPPDVIESPSLSSISDSKRSPQLSSGRIMEEPEMIAQSAPAAFQSAVGLQE